MSSGSPFPESQSLDAGVLLPAQEEPLPADDAFTRFEENIDAQSDTADLVVVEEDPPPLGRSWAYDFDSRQFVAAPGAHGPLAIRGLSTLEQWVTKALQTARGAHPIYSDAYGIDLPADFFSGPVVAFPDDLFLDRVRTALLRHPRIVDVDSFAFTHLPTEEYVAVSFTVHTGQGENFNFQNVRVG